MTLQDTIDARNAIADSRTLNAIITLPWSAGLEDAMLAECDDHATWDATFEAWGEDWRVHLRREDSDLEVTP